MNRVESITIISLLQRVPGWMNLVYCEINEGTRQSQVGRFDMRGENLRMFFFIREYFQSSLSIFQTGFRQIDPPNHTRTEPIGE